MVHMWPTKNSPGRCYLLRVHLDKSLRCCWKRRRWCSEKNWGTLTRWWFQIFFTRIWGRFTGKMVEILIIVYVHPYLGKMNPIWLAHIFQMGWNHQLAKKPMGSQNQLTRSQNSAEKRHPNLQTPSFLQIFQSLILREDLFWECLVGSHVTFFWHTKSRL